MCKDLEDGYGVPDVGDIHADSNLGGELETISPWNIFGTDEGV